MTEQPSVATPGRTLSPESRVQFAVQGYGEHDGWVQYGPTYKTFEEAEEERQRCLAYWPDNFRVVTRVLPEWHPLDLCVKGAVRRAALVGLCPTCQVHEPTPSVYPWCSVYCQEKADPLAQEER